MTNASDIKLVMTLISARSMIEFVVFADTVLGWFSADTLFEWVVGSVVTEYVASVDAKLVSASPDDS